MMGVESMRLHGSKGRMVAYDGCGEHVITSSKGGYVEMWYMWRICDYMVLRVGW